MALGYEQQVVFIFKMEQKRGTGSVRDHPRKTTQKYAKH